MPLVTSWLAPMPPEIIVVAVTTGRLMEVRVSVPRELPLTHPRRSPIHIWPCYRRVEPICSKPWNLPVIPVARLLSQALTRQRVEV